jgi:hypothetical protein
MAHHRYGGCDTYFEEMDEGIYAIRAEARERQRAVNRIHQKALAEQLSRATAEEYEEDILDHMERMEADTMADVASMDIQTEIQWYMRPYLLDFLIEAHSAFQLLPDTLFLAINILDRYCSRRVVYKRHYQLVGCASLLIAAKYGDRKDRVPTIHELRSMCCGLYDDEMFTQMEWHVLQTLGWMIGHPTVDAFLQLAISEGSYDPEVEHMTWFLCELALYHRSFIAVRPSVLARSALALSRCILSRAQARPEDWSGAYDSSVVLELSNYISHPSQILEKKYASMHLSSVSRTVADFLRQQAQMHARPQAPPTPPVVNEHKSNDFLEPSTPQKGPHHSAIMQHGALTPPITPDTEYAGQPGYMRSNSTLHRVYPSTPTSHGVTGSMGHCPPPHHVQQQQQQMHYTSNPYHSDYVQ